MSTQFKDGNIQWLTSTEKKGTSEYICRILEMNKSKCISFSQETLYVGNFKLIAWIEELILYILKRELLNLSPPILVDWKRFGRAIEFWTRKSQWSINIAQEAYNHGSVFNILSEL